jgi:hypothetical protein
METIKIPCLQRLPTKTNTMPICTTLCYGVYLGTANQVQDKYKESKGMDVSDGNPDSDSDDDYDKNNLYTSFNGFTLICRDGAGLLCAAESFHEQGREIGDQDDEDYTNVYGLNLLTPSKLDKIQVKLNDVANTLMATNLNRTCQVFAIVSA